MIGGFGLPELIIILVIILIIFGAGKLPEIGRGLGQAIGNFKKSFKEDDSAQSSAPPHEIDEKAGQDRDKK